MKPLQQRHRVATPVPGRIRIVANETELRQAFDEYDAFWWNALKFVWSEEKLQYLGSEAEILSDDDISSSLKIMIVNFDNGDKELYPFGAMAEQLTKTNQEQWERNFQLEQLTGLHRCFEARESVDCFHMLALEPDAPARRLRGNYARAIICVGMQLLLPLVVAYYVMEKTSSDDGGFCAVAVGWNRPVEKVLNKMISFFVIWYIFNFLETQRHEWDSFPIHEMQSIGLMFTVVVKPIWSVIGVVINVLALTLSGLVSIIVVYNAENALELVLNSTALFFLVSVDNVLVDRYDFERTARRIRRFLNYVRLNNEIPIVYGYRRCHRLVYYGSKLIDVVQLFLALSTGYVLVCK